MYAIYSVFLCPGTVMSIHQILTLQMQVLSQLLQVAYLSVIIDSYFLHEQTNYGGGFWNKIIEIISSSLLILLFLSTLYSFIFHARFNPIKSHRGLEPITTGEG